MDAERMVFLARDALGDVPRRGRERGYLFNHGLRVANLARRLAAEIDEDAGVRNDLLFVAGLFHDVAKGDEPHAENGADRAKDILAGDLDDAQRAAVAEMIRDHCRRREPRGVPVASRVLQDADLLDHFGAQSVWLVLHDACDNAPRQCLDIYARWRSDERIADWRSLLNFEASRQQFDCRIAFERDFFRRLAEEEGVRPQSGQPDR